MTLRSLASARKRHLSKGPFHATRAAEVGQAVADFARPDSGILADATPRRPCPAQTHTSERMWWSSTMMEGSITFRVIRSVGSVPQKWRPDLYRRFPLNTKHPTGNVALWISQKGHHVFVIFLSNPMPSGTARKRNPSVCGLLSALPSRSGGGPSLRCRHALGAPAI